MIGFSAFAATIIASENFVASSAFADHGTIRGSGSIGAALDEAGGRPRSKSTMKSSHVTNSKGSDRYRIGLNSGASEEPRVGAMECWKISMTG